MAVARVFPRRTNATPSDEYAFVGDIPLFLPPEITEVHVSCTFSWDIPEAERLAHAWSRIAPVKIGGPAFGDPGGEFIPGMYLKPGYTITSRGCDNHCWFCEVPRREGPLREIEIKPGSSVQDNNILACSEEHIRAVFEMLKGQKAVTLPGGIDAGLLKPWHVDLFTEARVQEAFFAYDSPQEWDRLVEAMDIMRGSAWYSPRRARCYVLCGYPGDTIEAAEKRCVDLLRLGYFPFAMFYRDEAGLQNKTKEWGRFQRSWTRPAAINATRRTLTEK